MGPIRGLKRRKKAEKKVDQNVLASALSSLKQEQTLDWWDDFSKRITGPLSGSRNTKKFESVFKISRKTFNYICSLVNNDLKARQSNLTGTNGKPLSPNDQVAIALRRLSSGESLSSIGDSFGVNQSTVSHVTWRFVEAMEERGLHHLRWPSTETEMAAIKSKFEKIHSLPNCCGVIDTTHVVMTLPAVDHSNDVWIDREKNHSMVLQAIVDPDMRFRDVIVGYPGSLSDALVLQNSSFFKLSEEGKRLNGKKMELMEGTELGEYIIGDAGFPLMPWLFTPYQHPHQEHQIEFNNRHSATMLLAQIALTRLKEIWRIIHGVMWLPDKNRLPRIIFVCCLLHNIVIDMEDKVLDEMPVSDSHDKDYRQQICESASNSGTEMREKLSLYLSGHPGNRVPRDTELVKSQEMPFHKSSFVWGDIESMEVFRLLPQKPHFSPLIEFEEASREGVAMRHMMTFAMLVEKTSKLRVDDPRNLFQSYLEILANLRLHGFDVKAVMDRLNMLLSMKDRYEQLKGPSKNGHVQLIEHNYEMMKLEEGIDKTDKTISESGEKQAMKVVTKDSGNNASKVDAEVISADILSTKLQFESLAAAPW
ncbi:protein ALP1-like [Ricinus communis]|uniref:RNA binding protein, putative n=1 Tax=Ricinus communis TaxID=3988 RepID=B9T165_RICCO|nr:protein ALP1-like [Ricinus communis]EEF30419.1 RNA binding protein, putative [Ricinus communis]|eukprot:XP_002531983.1 protein ALP1-like [Ricinus communis]